MCCDRTEIGQMGRDSTTRSNHIYRKCYYLSAISISQTRGELASAKKSEWKSQEESNRRSETYSGKKKLRKGKTKSENLRLMQDREGLHILNYVLPNEPVQGAESNQARPERLTKHVEQVCIL